MASKTMTLPPDVRRPGERNMAAKQRMIRTAATLYAKADAAADHGDVDHAAELRERARGLEVAAR
jgi:hypothetical protein